MLSTAWPHIWPALPLVGVFMASTSIIWLCYEAIAITALYPSRVYLPQKARVFIEFVAEKCASL